MSANSRANETSAPTQSAGTDSSADLTEALEREAEFVAQAIFGVAPGPEMVALYVRANRTLFSENELLEKTTGAMGYVVKRELDLEAIELALRGRDPAHPIKQKAHIMCYLAEIHAPFYRCFHNDRRSLVQAYLVMGLQTGRTLWKWLKGRYLLWSHGLA